jgi:hypothetical protein
LQHQDEEEDFFYQPHRDRGQRLDPAITRMALGAGGVTVLVVLIAFAWSGFHGGTFGPPPVINPPDVPLRVAPASPGGLVVPGADVPIMSGQTNDNGAPQLAPQSQAPDVAQLDQAAGLNQPPPAPPAAAPATPAQPAASPAPATAATTANPPAAVPTAPQPVAPEVQLAAVVDEGKAEAAWLDAQKKAPDLLGGKTPVILPAVVNGQSVWRVRLAGFASMDDAKALCTALAAKGVACLVPRS